MNKRISKKKKQDLTARLIQTKINYKNLWEEAQELRKQVVDYQKGLEQIEENLDTFMGAFIVKLGGEVKITKEELFKKYEVVRSIEEDGYSFKAVEKIDG